MDIDLKNAMRAGDERTKTVLRLVRAGVKNAEVAKRGPLDEAGVLAVIAKEMREHQESLTEFRKANRADLAEVAEAELAILARYMPPQMSRDEIIIAAKAVIAQVGAAGPADKGKVMGVITAQLRGKADGRLINEVVSELLASAG
jgi:hypothetical protein